MEDAYQRLKSAMEPIQRAQQDYKNERDRVWTAQRAAITSISPMVIRELDKIREVVLPAMSTYYVFSKSREEPRAPYWSFGHDNWYIGIGKDKINLGPYRPEPVSVMAHFMGGTTVNTFVVSLHMRWFPGYERWKDFGLKFELNEGWLMSISLAAPTAEALSEALLKLFPPPILRDMLIRIKEWTRV
jgi:hypothetical protein